MHPYHDDTQSKINDLNIKINDIYEKLNYISEEKQSFIEKESTNKTNSKLLKVLLISFVFLTMILSIFCEIYIDLHYVGYEIKNNLHHTNIVACSFLIGSAIVSYLFLKGSDLFGFEP